MTQFEPAFEVTRVDSMQWNRTAPNFTPGVDDAPMDSTVYPLPADLLDRVRAAVRRETGYVSEAFDGLGREPQAVPQ